MAHDGPDLTSLLLETDSLDGFLDALAAHALACTPTARGCGITVSREGRPVTVASAGSSATELDEKQYGLDDGPCLRALRLGEEIMVPDMLAERRWGPYPSYAVASGVRSSFSVPVAARTHTAGALNLYSAEPEGFAESDVTRLRGIAAEATGAIALAQRISDAQEFAEHLQTALASRTVIDQAIGIIMGQRRCDAEQAFDVLRGASQNRNVKLRDLCADLVTNVGGRPPQERGLRPRP
ncbi:GAF and ANTAR domain-containing protein [Streptomyces sp. TRM 70351]|uniref:GAF and ANTAR domain-containing protein n=1 Tax=Streptomyces sp. TRM 70351 TaxID=3116552 RepID=UPI002E7BBC97|nr:GAF and ANTAR domain-containing protein [Streptomyces sp. TRM 70351]MEE1930191.1 GAF and ANTAR domain-containing protein [Streptomyces sp. TRM 70351]